jgi:hypothetical protein
MKKPGILTRIYARCVLIYGRAYNFVGDAITLVKVASVEFWKMLCLIWKTWSFGTTWQCIKLTFGAMIMV